MLPIWLNVTDVVLQSINDAASTVRLLDVKEFDHKPNSQGFIGKN